MYQGLKTRPHLKPLPSNINPHRTTSSQIQDPKSIAVERTPIFTLSLMFWQA